MTIKQRQIPTKLGDHYFETIVLPGNINIVGYKVAYATTFHKFYDTYGSIFSSRSLRSKDEALKQLFEILAHDTALEIKRMANKDDE